MSCYDGGVSTISTILEEWHSFEALLDSVTGRSPLVQICRSLKEITEEFSESITFHRIGSAVTDEILAATDYEANSNYNPLEDFSEILLDCKDGILALVPMTGFSGTTPVPIVGDDCIGRTLDDALSIRTSFLSAIGSLDPQKKEDWQAYIIALRSALEAIVASSITLDPWTTADVSFGLTYYPVYGFTGAPIANNCTMKRGQLTYIDTVLEGDGYYHHYVPFGNGYNPDLGSEQCLPPLLTSLNYVGYGFFRFNADSVFIASPYNTWCQIFRGLTSDFCEATQRYSTSLGWVDQSPPGVGWWEVPETIVEWKFELNSGIYSGLDKNLFNGYSFEWNTNIVYSTAETPEIEASVSPSSGTYFPVIDGEYNDPLQVTLTMTDRNSYEWPNSKVARVDLVLSGPLSAHFCIDACGNRHSYYP